MAADMAARRAANPTRYKLIADVCRAKIIADKISKYRALKTKPCSDCGQTYPFYVMQFDHREGGVKVKSVALMVYSTTRWAKVEAEIAKCDLVCANCHATRTWRRKEANGEAYLCP